MILEWYIICSIQHITYLHTILPYISSLSRWSRVNFPPVHPRPGPLRAARESPLAAPPVLHLWELHVPRGPRWLHLWRSRCPAVVVIALLSPIMRCWLWGVLGWKFSELAYCTGRLTQLGTLLRSIGVLRFEQSAAQIEVSLFHGHFVVLAPCLPRAKPSFMAEIRFDKPREARSRNQFEWGESNPQNPKPKLFCIIWSACIILLIGVEALLANTFKVQRQQLRDETSWPTSCFQNNVAIYGLYF